MLVAEKEHERDWVIELVHLLEIGDLVQIADVEDGEVLDTVGDPVEDFILAHTVGIPVTAKTNDNKTFFFGHDGLIDMPACDKVG